MTRNRVPKRISLTQEQIEAVDRYAAQHNLNFSELVRKALASMIEDFPDNMASHGGKREVKQ